MDSADRESLWQCARNWLDAGWEIHVLRPGAPYPYPIRQCQVHNAAALLPIVVALNDHWEGAIAVVVVSGDLYHLEAHLAYVMSMDGNGHPVRLLNLRTPWDRFRADLAALRLPIHEMRALHEYVPR